MNLPEAEAGLGPIRMEEPEWWVVAEMWNGELGRSGPYTKPEAAFHMRCTIWRPGVKPRLKRESGNDRSWANQIAARKLRKKRLAAANAGRRAKGARR